MTKFQAIQIPQDYQDDLRADARAAMFSALRSAFKHRSTDPEFRAKDLADALGKDKSYISRVLNGTSGSIDFETLVVFLEALGYHLPLDPISYEDLRCKKVNFDARPAGVDFEVDTNQSLIVNKTKITHKAKHVWTVHYEQFVESEAQANPATHGLKVRVLDGGVR